MVRRDVESTAVDGEVGDEAIHQYLGALQVNNGAAGLVQVDEALREIRVVLQIRLQVGAALPVGAPDLAPARAHGVP